MTPIQYETPLKRPRIRTCEELGGPSQGSVLCALADLDGANSVLLVFGDGADRREVFIQGFEGGAVAYINACPHFNISLNWREPKFLNGAGDRFLCVNHYAQFRISDGYCDEGVCEGHWLVPVAIRVEDGQVLAG